MSLFICVTLQWYTSRAPWKLQVEHCNVVLFSHYLQYFQHFKHCENLKQTVLSFHIHYSVLFKQLINLTYNINSSQCSDHLAKLVHKQRAHPVKPRTEIDPNPNPKGNPSCSFPSPDVLLSFAAWIKCIWQMSMCSWIGAAACRGGGGGKAFWLLHFFSCMVCTWGFLENIVDYYTLLHDQDQALNVATFSGCWLLILLLPAALMLAILSVQSLTSRMTWLPPANFLPSLFLQMHFQELYL